MTVTRIAAPRDPHERAYAMLLLLYPHRFRTHYAPAMRQAFRDLLRDARGSGRSVRTAWMRVARELPLSLAREHLSAFFSAEIRLERMLRLLILYVPASAIVGGYAALTLWYPRSMHQPIMLAMVEQQWDDREQYALWQEIRDEDRGFSLRIPPILLPAQPTETWYGLFRRSVIRTTYAAPEWPETRLRSDKLIVSFHGAEFSWKNVLQRDIFWPMSEEGAEKIMLSSGLEGIHWYYHDAERVTEHYAFPDKNGRIVDLAFVTYPDAFANVLPYKEQILYSLRLPPPDGMEPF